MSPRSQRIMNYQTKTCGLLLTALALLLLVDPANSLAATLPGNVPQGTLDAFGVGPDKAAKKWTVNQIACTAPGNVVYPGEQATWTLQFTNKTDQPLTVGGKVEVITYRTFTPGADVFM